MAALDPQQNPSALRQAQQFNPSDPTVIPYTVQVMGARDAAELVGTDGVEIISIDANASEVRTYGIAAVQALLDATVLSFPGLASVDLPDELLSITITYNTNQGYGASSHPTSQQDFFATWTDTGSAAGQFNPRSQAQASASILPSAQINIRRNGRFRVASMHYYFYMDDTFTQAQLITRLNAITGSTVTALPLFRPVEHSLTLNGQSVSISQQADSRNSLSMSGPAGAITQYAKEQEWGSGFSEEVGTSVRSDVIPPTIHGTITISGALQTAVATVDVDASSPAIPNSEGVATTPITNDPMPHSKTIQASVTPSVLPATNPSSIPTSGLYLVNQDVNPAPYFGRVRVFAEVVNFTQFA